MSEKDPILTPSLEENENVTTAEAVVTEETEVEDTTPVVEEAAAEEAAPVVKDTAPVVEDAVVEDTAPVVVETEVEDATPVVKEQKKQKEKKVKGEKHRKMRTYQQRQNRLGYAFMSPWILGFLIFTLFPFAATIYLSFTFVKSSINGYEINFVGVDNYITAFIKNSAFVPSLIEYLKIIVPYTFIVVVLSFIIAYLLNKITKGKGILRTIYFLPVIIMSGPVMSQLLAVDNAAQEAAEIAGVTITNDYSNIFIMQIINSYSHPLAEQLGLIFDQLSIILWFTGIPIVLFINGLQKINISIYEAAKIDSANAWQIMWKITIPMLKQIGLIITIFTVIQLGMYDAINPVYKLIVDATGDTTGGLGFAATYAWIYSLVALLLVGIVFLLFKDKKRKRGA